MAITEKLGQFYLGRTHDLASGRTSATDDVLYDAKDLTTHAVCVGMTGSGKTGLCLGLLEEAAIDGIPAICIDPKGDIGNLMLQFPNLSAEEFQPWIDPGEATRKGQSVPEYAKSVSELWKKGLADWGQGPERIKLLKENAEVEIYTPASRAGKQLTVLRSFNAPSAVVMNDDEALRERIMAAVSGLLALMQIEGDPISSREHILLSTILDHAWKAGLNVDMGTLIRSIQAPDFDKVGFLDLESFYPAKERFKLAMSLNNLLASPSFAAWLEGEALDVQKLFYTPEGKPRIAVVSIAHLSDEERMFFVTILLNEVLGWMRSQPGTSSLRALLYMDEVFGYFPPTANPPSKQPMLTLLKQARAFGLGCVLATQNPVDLDYKGLSNAGTWFLGRLQTERDKMRVLEGLEGAASSAGSTFDRQKMEQTLAGLGSRVFLMNNVHEDQPVVFHTRWALSYLRGPISRQQIETLMDPIKARQEESSSRPSELTAERSEAPKSDRPILPPGITEVFWRAQRPDESITYCPALIAEAQLHFVSSKLDVDRWQDLILLHMCEDNVPTDPWTDMEDWSDADSLEMNDHPEDNSQFQELPEALTVKKSYTKWESTLKDSLYRNRRLSLWTCKALSATSNLDESETDFRIRLRHAAREERDLRVEKVRAKHASAFRTLEDRIRRAEQKVERETAQRSQKTMSAGISVLTSIAGALFGRKLRSVSNVTRAGSAMKSASSLAKESADIRHASEALESLLERREDLNAEVEDDVARIQDELDPTLMELDQEEIKPRKSDIEVTRMQLVWVPHVQNRRGTMERFV
ncbi:MAG: ATP-binding protein [Fuerstiella sp.]